MKNAKSTLWARKEFFILDKNLKTNEKFENLKIFEKFFFHFFSIFELKMGPIWLET